MTKLKYILIVIGVLAFTSCEDYLEQYPKTELATPTFYTSYDNALRNVAILYARLGNADNGINGSERFSNPSIMQQGGFQWTSTGTLNFWSKYYAYIAQANLILVNIQENQGVIDETLKSSKLEKGNISTLGSEQLMGEVRFLRAYAYFTLYRYFGGVPLIKTPVGANPEYVPRATRQEMFKFLYEEMEYALSKCADNNSGIDYGRVTKGTVAGMLAKMKIFHASYITRAEKYGTKIDETTDDDIDKTTLYADGLKLCNDLISGSYGTYALQDYFPAVFTKRTNEILFSVLAEEGAGTGNLIPMGITGTAKYGAAGGTNLTSWVTLLYDIPMWEHDYRLMNVARDYGHIDRFNAEPPKSGTTPNDLINIYDATGKYTLTGDTTRRMWTTVKGWITGPDNGGAPLGLWVFEPAGRYLGDEFFIPPGKVDDYTAEQNAVMNITLEPHERPWWRNQTLGQNRPDMWNVNWWFLAKFRNSNPQDVSATFNINNAGVDYPILRLAEIYLLKAEAQLMQGNIVEAVKSINVIRDRACHQSTSRDMFLYHGDAAYTYIPGSVLPIPASLTQEQVFKELIFERIRELAGEDDCGWLDVARFPDNAMEDLGDICRYGDPLQGYANFGDPSRGEYLWDLFNADLVYKVLLPIPFTELSFFPEMKQNPGY